MLLKLFLRQSIESTVRFCGVCKECEAVWIICVSVRLCKGSVRILVRIMIGLGFIIIIISTITIIINITRILHFIVANNIPPFPFSPY
jgi:hypothetical protein